MVTKRLVWPWRRHSSHICCPSSRLLRFLTTWAGGHNACWTRKPFEKRKFLKKHIWPFEKPVSNATIWLYKENFQIFLFKILKRIPDKSKLLFIIIESEIWPGKKEDFCQKQVGTSGVILSPDSRQDLKYHQEAKVHKFILADPLRKERLPKARELEYHFWPSSKQKSEINEK